MLHSDPPMFAGGSIVKALDIVRGDPDSKKNFSFYAGEIMNDCLSVLLLSVMLLRVGACRVLLLVVKISYQGDTARLLDSSVGSESQRIRCD